MLTPRRNLHVISRTCPIHLRLSNTDSYTHALYHQYSVFNIHRARYCTTQGDEECQRFILPYIPTTAEYSKRVNRTLSASTGRAQNGAFDHKNCSLAYRCLLKPSENTTFMDHRFSWSRNTVEWNIEETFSLSGVTTLELPARAFS